MFATFIMPLLSHLILLPLMVCAAIYYPLMVVLAALGALFPYLLAIGLLFMPYYFFKKSKKQIYKRKRHILIPITAIFSIIVPWVIAEMWCSSSYSYNSDTLMIVALSAMALAILLFMGMTLTAEEDEMDVFDDEVPMNRWSKVLIIGGLVSIIAVSAFSFYAYDSMQRMRRDVEDREVVIRHTHIVNTPSLNIRSGPGSKYAVAGKLSNGDLITVLREEKGWAIINYNGAEAYVSAKYLKRNE